jgi:hypothetical protein
LTAAADSSVSSAAAAIKSLPIRPLLAECNGTRSDRSDIRGLGRIALGAAEACQRSDEAEAGYDGRGSGGRDRRRPRHIGFGGDEHEGAGRDRGGGGEDGEQARRVGPRVRPLRDALVE